MKRFRPRLSYANVVSSLSLFLVLVGGTAFAATNLPKNSVGSPQIKKNAVKTGDIARNAVRVGKLAPEAAKAGKIAKNAIVTNRLRNNAVTGEKVQDGSLQAADFAPGQLPAGPQGEPGPQGDPGVAEIVTRVTSEEVAPGGVERLTASCLAGEVATGGGVGFNNPNEEYTVMLSEPLEEGGTLAGEGEVPTQWTGKARNESGLERPMTTYVICAKVG